MSEADRADLQNLFQLLASLHFGPKLIEFLLQLDILGVGPLDVAFLFHEPGAFPLSRPRADRSLSLAVLPEYLLDDFRAFFDPPLQLACPRL